MGAGRGTLTAVDGSGNEPGLDVAPAAGGVAAPDAEARLRDRATSRYLAAYEREHGPFTHEEQQAAADIWSRAEGAGG